MDKKKLALVAGHERLDTTGVRGPTPYPCRIQSFSVGSRDKLLSEKVQPLLSRVLAQLFSLAQYGVHQCCKLRRSIRAT